MPESSKALADRIADGSSLALAPDYSGCSLTLIKALIRRGARDLHLIGCPQLGLQAELLIAAGCVASLETAAIGLGEAGRAPAFDQAYREGRIKVWESTCPAIHSGLQAAEKGLPFMPVASIMGSDLPKLRPDWREIEDPYSGGNILIVPAIKPDFALFHAPLADPDGAVWIGVRRELMMMAHAARTSLVSVEEVRGASLIADPSFAPGTIPGIYIDEVVEAPFGARPSGLFGAYEADQSWKAAYLEHAKHPQSRMRFLDGWLAA